MKVVAVLEEGEEEEFLVGEMNLGSGSRSQDASGSVSQAVDPPGKRLSAVLNRVRSERPQILSYDEIIEGPPKVAFPDDLEFEFEIPQDGPLNSVIKNLFKQTHEV